MNQDRLQGDAGMRIFPALLVCACCDSVYHRPMLAADENARCGRCLAVLVRGSALSVDGWFALTLAGAIMFIMANVSPVVHVGLKGLQGEATLWQAAAALSHGPWAPIAVPAAFCMVIAPMLQIALLGWILAYARHGRRAPGFIPAMRVLIALRPWSMVEVALLGILVSMIKLSGLAQAVPGVGLWATAGLAALLTLITHRELQGLWQLPATEPLSTPVHA